MAAPPVSIQQIKFTLVRIMISFHKITSVNSSLSNQPEKFQKVNKVEIEKF